MKTIQDFLSAKKENRKIVMVTCYDYWSAKILNNTDIDSVLVGDSASMVMHGFKTTVNASIAMMVNHVQAVKRGMPDKFLVADMPFLEHRKGLTRAMNGIDRLMKAGAQAIKLEGADGNLELVEHIVKSGVPTMGHLGLTPQSVHKFGGFKVQGKGNGDSLKLIEDAKKLEGAGCFSIVLELVPSETAAKITEALKIPTIGIGAGSASSGQILVLQDLLGMDKDFNPKFLKKYLNGFELITSAINSYAKEVKEVKFPSKEESF
jgi:3-methyl-2-oxobutanoate hydroxymethyltransferase